VIVGLEELLHGNVVEGRPNSLKGMDEGFRMSYGDFTIWRLIHELIKYLCFYQNERSNTNSTPNQTHSVHTNCSLLLKVYTVCIQFS
jgi:hypothetical protein